MARDLPRRPAPIGVRGGVLASLVAAGVWATLYLGLTPASFVPNGGGLEIAGEFFARALSPAFVSEATYVPDGTPLLLVRALQVGGTTLVFAGAGMSLALVLGLVLGFFASSAWWEGDPAGGRSRTGTVLRRTIAPAIWGASRVLITFMRSIHELLWAILFLCAFGLNDVGAILAIAIPYGGTLAKIFSEMVDEAPRAPAHALRAGGAGGLQVFFFGLATQAVPDMIAYTFYRFECAIRSSAVLGFFGYETLGLEIRQSFASLNYGEVWTFLYVLIAMIVLFDWWSGAVRRRLTA